MVFNFSKRGHRETGVVTGRNMWLEISLFHEEYQEKHELQQTRIFVTKRTRR